MESIMHLGRANVVFHTLQPRTFRVEAMPLESFRTLYVALYLNVFVDAGRVWDSRYAAHNFLNEQWIKRLWCRAGPGDELRPGGAR
jgi:hypothetical protein